ncbi:glycosyltransferase [Chloropicon primus]|uniref:Glycosyltransferase n=1 Tax=Chloropicon primus TaxID=1764295 RepID=A0A5B8MUG9_9CHLO|nr:glycosyltransferase [Chloropicon primus]UPR02606.1 glycosyltransferase [Chloropicon primus]|eukprot:QDZ23394.1 glycosyltransferase [Chloropicon primus]
MKMKMKRSVSTGGLKKEYSYKSISSLISTSKKQARIHKLCMVLLFVVALSQAFTCTFNSTCGFQKSSEDFDRSFFGGKVTLKSEARFLIESFTNSDGQQLDGTLALRQTHGTNSNKKKIPKIIHQTYGSKALSSKLRYLVQSWRELNPGWEIRFYDDEACLNFVKQEFPEYVKAYVTLPKSVERSDFFRYMVIYKYGGVYTDIDTECKTPLDEVLLPTDTMVVGWEYEGTTQEDALNHHYVRANQVLQWTFMAAPGHPALREVCDFISNHATTKFSDNKNRDTLEKTGPGIFTDVVLRHSKKHPPFSVNDEELWPVRFLPWVGLGAHPDNKEGVRSDSSDVKVLHHFMGGWKSHFVCWSKCDRKVFRGHSKGAGFTSALHDSSSVKSELYLEYKERNLFPVSANFKPTFEMSVYRKGAEFESGQDANDDLFKYGRWQAGMAPGEKPGVVNALVGSLGGKKRSVKLLDIGAGIGFFSLAAAARGHDVESFEVSNMSLKAFETSSKRNGFEDFIKIHRVALSDKNENVTYGVPAGTSLGDGLRHGYPSLEMGLGGQKQKGAGGGDKEQVTVQYKRLEDVISLNETVGAVRISVNGWENAVIDGGMALFKHKTNYPSIVLVEMNYKASVDSGHNNPTETLFKLYNLGYTKISHAGPICKRRWKSQTRSIFSLPFSWVSGGSLPTTTTWCSLGPEDFQTFLHDKHSLMGENVIFYKPRDWSVDKQLMRYGEGASSTTTTK